MLIQYQRTTRHLFAAVSSNKKRSGSRLILEINPSNGSKSNLDRYIVRDQGL